MFKQILMVDVTPGTTLATMIGGILAPWISLFYGPNRLIPIILLVSVTAMDWVTGIAASKKIKHILRSMVFDKEYRVPCSF